LINFEAKELKLEHVKTCDDIRSAYQKLSNLLEEEMHYGRHKSLALTNLELSCMWAIKGILHGPEG